MEFAGSVRDLAWRQAALAQEQALCRDWTGTNRDVPERF